MLTNEQIDTIDRLHFVEKWTVRQIARHLHIGRRTVAKYLVRPAQTPPHPSRGSKLDRFKPTIEDWLEREASTGEPRIFAEMKSKMPQEKGILSHRAVPRVFRPDSEQPILIYSCRSNVC